MTWTVEMSASPAAATDGTGWVVGKSGSSNSCGASRAAQADSVHYLPQFREDRAAIGVKRVDWGLDQTVKPVRVELVGRGSVGMIGIHNGDWLLVLLPERDSRQAQQAMELLKRTRQLRVTSEVVPGSDPVLIPIDGFSGMLERLEACEDAPALAAKQNRLDALQRAECALALRSVSLSIALSDNLTEEERETVESDAASFEETCQQPRVGGVIRAALLDKDYGRASSLAAAACESGNRAGCHLGAVLAVYGNNTAMSPAQGRRETQRLCDGGLAVSCRMIEIWADN